MVAGLKVDKYAEKRQEGLISCREMPEHLRSAR